MGGIGPYLTQSMAQDDLNKLWDSGWFTLENLPGIAAELDAALRNKLVMHGSHGYTGVLALQGAMGSGKTTLMKALCAQWNVLDEAASPTFGLVHEYHVQDWTIFHHDLYRLKNEEEAWDMGLSEYFSSLAFNVVEWPERAPGLMPSDALLLDLEVESMAEDASRRAILWEVVNLEPRMY